MALCSHTALLSQTTCCGQSSDYPGQFECVALKDSTRDITGHLASLKLSTNEGVGTEMKLLLDCSQSPYFPVGFSRLVRCRHLGL